MVSISRRDATKLLIAGCGSLAVMPGPPRTNSVVRGVQIGAQSYSFRDLPLTRTAAIAAFQAVGLGECELSQLHVEPQELKGAALREWRLSVPLSQLQDIRRQFDDAGILLYAYAYNFRKEMTDAEMERGFQMTEAMGMKYLTASTNVSLAPRLDALAQKYRIMLGFHGHDNTADPDEFSTAESFARAMNGASRYIGVNLDIGHFTAAGGDAVEYIRQYHDRIVTIHIKDRKKNHGANLPFGEGDTPIVAVLRLLRDQRWNIPANIEYEYGKPGMDPVVEVKRCYAYCRKALES
jgi:sugar phosphate isomerase/epimerase